MSVFWEPSVLNARSMNEVILNTMELATDIVTETPQRCKLSSAPSTFKNPLCLRSRNLANKFCINPSCTRNAFCCKYCSD